MEATWNAVKNFVQTYSIPVHWVDLGNTYYLTAFQGAFILECYLAKDGSSDQTDFETNFKSVGNQQVYSNIQSQPPYGAKTIIVNGVTHKLYSRFTGLQFSVNSGTNTLTYTATYTWAKLIGVEAINCEALDTVDFKVYDNTLGTYSGVPNTLLNQFSYSLNLPKDFYQRMAQFDADVYQGMVIEITYNSKSNKTIGINLLLDQVV